MSRIIKFIRTEKGRNSFLCDKFIHMNINCKRPWDPKIDLLKDWMVPIENSDKFIQYYEIEPKSEEDFEKFLENIRMNNYNIDILEDTKNE